MGDKLLVWFKFKIKFIFELLMFIIGIFLFVFGTSYLVALIFQFTSSLDKTVLISIISAISVILGSTFVKNKELKYLILKESREKKAPSYLMAIKLLLEDQMATNEEFGFDKKIVLDNEGLKKIRSRIIDLTSELFIWGSDEVVNEWSLYRNDIKAKDDLVAQRGKIISLIRTELGYNQKIILPK